MAINLRHVSKELHGKLNVKAAQETVTLESLCVRYLWQGLGDNDGAQDEAMYGPRSKPKDAEDDEIRRWSRPPAIHHPRCKCSVCKGDK